MKSIFKRLSVCMLAVFLAVSMTACKPDSSPDSTGGESTGGESTGPDLTPVKYDPETRPVKFAISTLDGNFNPFFATSAPDSEIVSMTQIGMLSSDNDGNVACGEDEPTVVLDYKITSYNSNGGVTTGDDADHTTYEFVIKNGIKFSDGVDLTVKDVLFNLYAYLDPMYTGSSTIYSTDIRGLKAYRENDPNLADDSTVNTDAAFRAAAQLRINNMLAWADGDMDETEQIKSDVEKVQKRFKEDLQTDWTANFDQYKGETNQKQFNFNANWQWFYYVEGIVTINSVQNDKGYWVDEIRNEKDELVDNIDDGKYVTSLDDSNNDLTVDMEEALSDQTKIAEYKAKYNCDDQTAKEYIERDMAINTVYMSYADDIAIKSGLATIIYGSTTGNNILNDFTAEERSAYFDKPSSENVESISGITTEKVTSFDGVNGTDLKGEEHDLLKITINGVDPKAIWNFGFTVAPMHYYSNEDAIKNTPFGVKARNKDFFDEVLKAAEKTNLPVGAGVYRASNEKGNASENPSEVNSADFKSNKSVYFQRNDYFYTVGSGLCNAKIKYFTYMEVGENNILNRLVTKDIDYGNPGATQPNINEISKYSDYLSYRQYQTNGYGYVGINPKFVPEVQVRRAIMKAMNTNSVITDYYTGGLAVPIYRPMTKLSWAYPEDATQAYYSYDPNGEEIEALVQQAGYQKNTSTGIYEKNGVKLEFKFTIAGETNDHPACAMFNRAAQTLNAHGFKITVGTDTNALKKLATGNLAVWAAAWTSTIDPDMYQIYHKDTTATSRFNWNYDEILNDSTDKYKYEREKIGDLSKLIEEGRETNNQDERKVTYAKALDCIMDLAVELPTYQRNDLAVFNSEFINPLTLNQEQNLKYESPISQIWLLNYN